MIFSLSPLFADDAFSFDAMITAAIAVAAFAALFDATIAAADAAFPSGCFRH